MPKRKVYIRADGSSSIGLGHVTRSLALADMLKKEFECYFIIRNPLETLQKQILNVCRGISILPETDNDIDEAKYLASNILSANDIIVLDGYHFNTEYQKIFKIKGCKLVCIDDIHSYHFVADVVINHAFKMTSSDYSRENYTKIFTGFEYCLLRKPFLNSVNIKNRVNANKENVFICFGGTDYHNLTLKSLKAIIATNVEFECIDIVMGAASKKEEILSFIEKNKIKNVKVYFNLSAEEISLLMRNNYLALIPASTISMECFAVGSMKIICGYFVENQLDYYNKLQENGVITPVGDFCKISIDEYSDVIKYAIEDNSDIPIVIDNKIPRRLISIFKEL